MYMNDLKEKKLRGEKITSITAYDYSFARVADEAGFDIILVGDSLGNHQRCQTLAEWVVVRTGLPNTDFLRLPCLQGANGNRLLGHKGNVTTS